MRASRWVPTRWFARGDRYRRPPLLLALMLGHASWTRNDQSPCKRRLIVEADTLDELESDENIEFDNGVIELPIDDCLTHCVHVRRTVELELRRYRPA